MMLLLGMKEEWGRLSKDHRSLRTFLLLPIAAMFLMGYLLNQHTITQIPIAVVDPSMTQESQSLVGDMGRSQRFALDWVVRTQEEGELLLESDQVQAVITLPADLSERLAQKDQATIFLGVNAINPLIGNSVIASFQEIAKTDSIKLAAKPLVAKGKQTEQAMGSVLPITIQNRPWFNPQFSYTNYLLIGIIVVALHQTIVQTTATAYSKDMRGNQAFLYLLGRFLLYFVVGLGISILTLVLTIRIFAIPMQSSWLVLAALCVPFAFATTSFGLLVGSLSETRLYAMQWSILTGMPIFLISGYTWPHAVMPRGLVLLSQLFPLTHFASNIRGIALMGFSLADLTSSHLFLWALGGVMFAAGMWMQRREVQPE